MEALHLQNYVSEIKRRTWVLKPRSFDPARAGSFQAISAASVSNKTNVDLGVEPRSFDSLSNSDLKLFRPAIPRILRFEGTKFTCPNNGKSVRTVIYLTLYCKHVQTHQKE